jgi:hypothetical protein
MHDQVKKMLLGERPCSIGKIGSIELLHFGCWVTNNKKVHFGDSLAINAGINVRNEEEYSDWLNDFGKSLSNIDCLLAWNKNEIENQIIKYICNNPLIVPEFSDIEPFAHKDNGWHYQLEDKKVLVISSFKDSIESQIPNFSKIWVGAKLGNCEVIRCPQPHQITGGNPIFYSDAKWQLADQIANRNFDICIIGAGGYSLFLCDLIKNMGRKSIHLGGATQVLFGIRGSRFDRNFSDQNWYGTDSFIKPLESDIPKYHNLVENSCYW